MPTPYSTAQNTATAHRPQTFKDVIGQETPKAALKAIAKAPATSFHSIVLAGPYGTGKCVSGDTHIQTENGIRQIRALFPPIKEEDTQYDLDKPTTLRYGSITLPVSYLYYSGVKPTIEYINHNTTLARTVNCFGRGRRGIPSKTNRIGHRSVCRGDTSLVLCTHLNRRA